MRRGRAYVEYWPGGLHVGVKLAWDKLGPALDIGVLYGFVVIGYWPASEVRRGSS